MTEVCKLTYIYPKNINGVIKIEKITVSQGISRDVGSSEGSTCTKQHNKTTERQPIQYHNKLAAGYKGKTLKVTVKNKTGPRY